MYVTAAFTCPNFHFSVSFLVPFLNLLFEPDSYSNEYLLAKFGFATAENKPSKVCPIPQRVQPSANTVGLYQEADARRKELEDLEGQELPDMEALYGPHHVEV